MSACKALPMWGPRRGPELEREAAARCRFMLVDVVLGQIVLAIVAQASIIGMVYRPREGS